MSATNPGKFTGARKLTFFPAASTLEAAGRRVRLKHKLPEAVVFLEGNR